MTAAELIDFLADRDIRLTLEGGRLRFDAAPGAVTPAIRELLVARKDELICLLGGMQDAGMPTRSNVVSGRAYPLSSAQRRMWFFDQLLGERDASLQAMHNNPFALRISGPLDDVSLREALARVVERHSILRTTFAVNDGTAMQVPHEALHRWQVVHALGTSASAQRHMIDAEVARTIDLGRGPVLRATLYHFERTSHVLLLVIHHIVSDGWSMEILSRELLEDYSALAARRDPPRRADVLQFADQAVREQNAASLALCESMLPYWRDKLAQLPMQSALPADRPRPSLADYVSAAVPFEQPLSTTQALKHACRLQRTTLFVWLLTVFKLLIARYTGELDIVVGTAMASRNEPALENMIGYFANTVVLRTRLGIEQSFLDFMCDVRTTVRDAEAHQMVPFERLVAELQPERSQAHAPLFQTLFILQMADAGPVEAGGAQWRPEPVASAFSPYDLTVYLHDSPTGLRGTFRYATALFDDSTIQVFSRQFAALIECSLTTQQAALAHTLFAQVVAGPPRSTANFDTTDSGWLDSFACQVRRTPDAVAVSCGGRSLSYAQLESRSAALACRLRAAGVSTEDIVAVSLDRDETLLVSLLAVARSGAAYLPLDPSTPPARNAYIMKDARVQVCLSRGSLEGAPATALTIDPDADAAPTITSANAPDLPIAQSLAYVIYTSGTTGHPKGVAVTHANLTNLLVDMSRRLPIDNTSRVAAATTVSFDIAALELFAPLIVGGEVVLIDRDTATDGDALARALANDITVFQATPATWQMLLATGWTRPAAMTALCGGEALPPELLARLTANGGTLWNVYGPTETTIWSTAARLQSSDIVHLGEPVAGTSLRLLDDQGRPVPDGVAGQLYIGGVGVSRGYHGKPSLTAERFTPDPWGPPGARMYATGDLCRVRPDGRLVYLSRADAQLKIRGHRVEPAEIESVLRRDERIAQAVVVGQTDERGDTCLVAHVVPTDTGRPGMAVGLFFFSGRGASGGRATYEFVLEAARRADRAGFAAVWTPERHFHEVAGSFPNPAVLAAAIAVRTSDIDIRAGSVVLPLHDPLRVAEDWAVIDQLSGGRVGIAIASGWNRQDFALQPHRFEQRRDIFESLVAELRRAWRGEAVDRDVDGQTFAIRTFPRPSGSELPMWVSASNAIETFELAGRLGAGVLTHMVGQDIDALARKLGAYRTSLAGAGHDVAQGRVVVMLHTYVAESDEIARGTCAKPLADYLRGHIELDRSRLRGDEVADIHSEEALLKLAVERCLDTASLIGSVPTCLRMAERLHAIGVDELACLIDFGVAESLVLESISLLATVKDTLRNLHRIDNDDIRRRAGELLPIAMVPSAVVVHSRLPLTTSGKIDRRQLAQLRVPVAQEASVLPTRAPSGEIELGVAQLWREILGKTPTSTSADFFASGGHSLLASQLASRLRRHFDIEIPLRAIFDWPTLGGLAGAVEARLRDGSRTGVQRLSRAPSGGYFALASQQARQWNFVRQGHAAHVYNKSRAWRIDGPVDAARLERALQAAVRAHDVLRTAPVSDEVVTLQQVHATASASWRVDDRFEDDPQVQTNLWQAAAEEDARRPFEPTFPCALRLRLLQFGETGSVLLLTFHGMFLDGWAAELFLDDLVKRYEADGRSEDTDAGQPQFEDYIRWQRSDAVASATREDLRYWQARLNGLARLSEVPTDRPRRHRPSYAGASVPWTLGADALARCEALNRKEGTTLFTLLGTALAICLSRWSGSADVAFGTLFANREHVDTRHMLGFLANSLVVRSAVGTHASFTSALRAMRHDALEAFSHATAPFDEVIAGCGADPSSADPFREVFLVVHNQPTASRNIAGFAFHPLDVPTLASRYEICFSAVPTAGGLGGTVEYDTALFDAGTIEQRVGEWLALLEEAVRLPEAPLAALLERHRIGSALVSV